MDFNLPIPYGIWGLPRKQWAGALLSPDKHAIVTEAVCNLLLEVPCVYSAAFVVCGPDTLRLLPVGYTAWLQY